MKTSPPSQQQQSDLPVHPNVNRTPTMSLQILTVRSQYRRSVLAFGLIKNWFVDILQRSDPKTSRWKPLMLKYVGLVCVSYSLLHDHLSVKHTEFTCNQTMLHLHAFPIIRRPLTSHLFRSSLALRCATFHWLLWRRWSRGCDRPLVSSLGPDPLGPTAARGLSLERKHTSTSSEQSYG